MQRHNIRPLPAQLVRHRPRPLVQSSLGHAVGVPPPKSVVGYRPDPRAEIRHDGNGTLLARSLPPTPAFEKRGETLRQQQRSDGVYHHAFFHPGSLEFADGTFGSGGRGSAVAEDSGDVEEEVDAVGGKGGDLGDGIVEGGGVFDVELDGEYAVGVWGGEECLEAGGGFRGSAAGYNRSLVMVGAREWIDG